MLLNPVLQFEALIPFKMSHFFGNRDEVMRLGANREDQVEIIQRGSCFFAIGFQHCKDFSELPTNEDDFNGILNAIRLIFPRLLVTFCDL